MADSNFKNGLMLRVCTAATAIAVLVGVLAATAQALPTKFWGAVPQGVPSLEQFERLQRGGVESVRIPFGWPSIQSTRGGAFDWSAIDPQVEDAAKAGIDVLPFVSGAPSWAVPSVFVAGTNHSAKAPAHLPISGAGRAGWISFITAAVARYGPNGSFWAENPSVPKRPLRTWQIWNEANFKYFVARPNPAEYGKLVKISYPALKAADPGARVILGGFFAQPREAQINYKPPRAYFAADFLEQMYEKTPGIRSMFNGVALHPYTPRYQRLTQEIQEFRDVLQKNHDVAKGLWITELGWSSKPPTSRENTFAKGVAGQAAQLRGAFTLLLRNQVKWKLQSIYWFSVDDGFGCNFCDGSGLFADGFKAKKSWFEYVRFAGGTP